MDYYFQNNKLLFLLFFLLFFENFRGANVFLGEAKVVWGRPPVAESQTNVHSPGFLNFLWTVYSPYKDFGNHHHTLSDSFLFLICRNFDG